MQNPTKTQSAIIRCTISKDQTWHNSYLIEIRHLTFKFCYWINSDKKALILMASCNILLHIFDIWKIFWEKIDADKFHMLSLLFSLKYRPWKRRNHSIRAFDNIHWPDINLLLGSTVTLWQIYHLWKYKESMPWLRCAFGNVWNTTFKLSSLNLYIENTINQLYWYSSLNVYSEFLPLRKCGNF